MRKSQKWVQEAEWHNPEGNVGEPVFNMPPLWTGKAHKLQTLFKAILSSACRDWLMTQTCLYLYIYIYLC